ncbi:MAG: hypothetical protein OEQ18_10410 [Gammaproteobacteria bacterium]|nr:hypothetical protein [Gammaproteobacteria bacterium]
MKKLILAVVAAVALAGCIAVPVYDSGPGAYYGPPSPAIGVYVAPPAVYYGNRYRHRHRHYR